MGIDRQAQNRWPSEIYLPHRLVPVGRPTFEQLRTPDIVDQDVYVRVQLLRI